MIRKNIQSIYSCKRRATLILQELKKSYPLPKVCDLLNERSSFLGGIFCPLNMSELASEFEIYVNQKNIPVSENITRGLLLDFFAFSDSSQSWESFYNKQKNSNQKTYVLYYEDIVSIPAIVCTHSC